jgi:predicted GH43/DUF377 family glycosyl hydrolase
MPYDNGYYFRDKIIIDSSKVYETCANYPFLFSSTITRLKTTANGGKIYNTSDSKPCDLIFTNSAGTELYYEVVYYDASTGQLIAYVNVTSVSSSVDTTLYLYYGNPFQVVLKENPANTFSIATYRAVWHMIQAPTDDILDSTNNNFDMTPVNLESGDLVTGNIYKGIIFDGSDEKYTEAAPVLLNPKSGSWTISCFFKSTGTSYGATSYVFGDGNSGAANDFVGMAVSSGDNLRIYAKGDDDDDAFTTGSVDIVDEAWHYIACVKDGATWRNFVDTATDGTGTPTLTGNLTPDQSGIGCLRRSSDGNFIPATIEELRILRVARSAEWLHTERENYNDPANFYSVTEDNIRIESFEAASTGAITAGDNFDADLGIASWSSYDDPDGTSYYEIVTSQAKIGSKSLLLRATTSAGGDTLARVYSLIDNKHSLTKDLTLTAFVRRTVTLQDSGNYISVWAQFDDNGTERTLNYFVNFGGALPSDTSTNGYYDVSADFALNTWSQLTRSLYKDYDTKFASGRGLDPVFEKNRIYLKNVSLRCFHTDDTNDTNSEAYFDYVVLSDSYRIIEGELFPWNVLNASENDLWEGEGFTKLAAGTYTWEENPAGQMHLKATYNGGNANARLSWTDLFSAVSKDPTAGDITTHYFKFTATDLDVEGNGNYIRFYWRNAQDTFYIRIYSDKIQDQATEAGEQAVTITNGNTYFIRIVLTHGTAGSGTGAVYFNGSSTPLSIYAESGSTDSYNIGVNSEAAGSAEIQILAWKVGEGIITDENDFASDMPMIFHPTVRKAGAGDWEMWYMGARWSKSSDAEPWPPQRNTGRLFRATSTDGRLWAKDYTNNPVFTPSKEGGGKEDRGTIQSPRILHDGSDYWMYYSGAPDWDGAEAAGEHKQIFLAKSADGITWTRQNSGNPVVVNGGAGSNDERWTYAPYVVRVDASNWYMFYTGVSDAGVMVIKRATSSDGVTWTKDAVNDPILAATGVGGDWDEEVVLYPIMVRNGANDWEMFYTGRDENNYIQVGRATSTATEGAGGWTRDTVNSPVLPVSPTGWDDFYSSSGDIIVDGGVYKMYYFGRQDGLLYTGIGYAESADGTNFVRDAALYIENQNPAAAATEVNAASNIYFEVDSDIYPIDSTTIDVSIKQGPGAYANAIVSGVFQSGYSGTVTSDGTRGYDVTINPDNPLGSGNTVYVKVTAENAIGDDITNYVYFFATEGAFAQHFIGMGANSGIGVGVE